MWSEDDVSFMRRAIEVAERGRGRVSPNPLVGCVLVKNGEIIAEGWHDHLGGLHAEQMAIADAEAKGVSPNGASAYVTLEPCNHYGRTPPCTQALLWAGVKDVTIACGDPNPTVRGQGCTVLQEANVATRTGLLAEEAAKQMDGFLHWCAHRKPIVTLKIAVDAQGSVDDRAEQAQRFTSEACLDEVHKLRKNCDAILVGVETVIRDDPSLTIRRVESERQPLRVVIDPNSRIPENCKLLNDGYETMVLQSDFHGLEDLLVRLGDMEIQRLLVEGGPFTAKQFLQEKLVDECYFVESEMLHSQPFLSGIDYELIQSSNLKLTSQFQWGKEKVSYFSKIK